MRLAHQFSLSYLLCEVALLAIALGCGRALCSPSLLAIETEALCFLVALVAGCGALGGLFLRMSVGLIVGSVLAVACVPLIVTAVLSTAG